MPILNLDAKTVEDVKKKFNFESNFKYIVLGISASGPTKRWDINHYIRLGEQLCKKFPCKFYLAGGKNDQHLADKILSSSIGQNSLSFINLNQEATMNTL